MARLLQLPSGATCMVKDPHEILVKDRKRILQAAEVQGEISRALAIGDALVAMMITQWSYKLDLPADNIAVLDEIPMGDYDKLIEESSAAQKVIFPTLGDTVENETDPKAISADSNA